MAGILILLAVVAIAIVWVDIETYAKKYGNKDK